VRETSSFTDDLLDTVRHWDGTLLRPSSENRERESVRVFKADWFEGWFATAHPAFPGAFWGPVIAGCIYFSVRDTDTTLAAGVAMFGLGFLLWTLLEYVLHRYLFHLAPEPTFESKLKQFMVHGYHHEFPNDRMRLVAPLILSGPISIVTAALYYVLAGPQYWLTGFAGTVAGYLAYDWIHYYTHHFRPTTRLGKYLRRYHMEHHYRDSESHFGISSPLWDWVFGTARSKKP
jgi:sterol desaturase/sphingolipid hydroxylase (fatty acid hydroxylase superfamily)